MLRGGTVAGEQIVEPLEHVVIEFEGYGAPRVIELGEGPRPDDRPGDTLLVQQPGQRHVGRLLAEPVAQVLVGRDMLAVLLKRLRGPADQTAAPFALLAEHAAEQPALQRRPRDDADAVLDRRGQHLELDLPGQQVVDGLLADQAEEAARGRAVVGLRDMPPREVGRADVDDLALGDEDLHRLPDLVPRGIPVDVVHLVQVDVIGLEPAQRRVAGTPDVQRGQLALVGPGSHRPVQLGGQDGPFPPPAATREPLADDLLGPARVGLGVLADLAGRTLDAAVAVGGVEEVDADLKRVIHDRVRLGERGQRPEIHRAQAEAAYRQARTAQVNIFHALSFSRWRDSPGGGRRPARGYRRRSSSNAVRRPGPRSRTAWRRTATRRYRPARPAARPAARPGPGRRR